MQTPLAHVEQEHGIKLWKLKGKSKSYHVVDKVSQGPHSWGCKERHADEKEVEQSDSEQPRQPCSSGVHPIAVTVYSRLRNIVLHFLNRIRLYTILNLSMGSLQDLV